MKRFEKTELISYINNMIKEIGREPRIIELCNYINSTFDKNDYSSYDDYASKLVSDSIVKHYIDIYGLEDMMIIKKRIHKNKPYIIEEDESCSMVCECDIDFDNIRSLADVLKR